MASNRWSFVLVWATLSLCAVSHTQAQSPVLVLANSDSTYETSGYLEAFVDASAQLALTDVRASAVPFEVVEDDIEPAGGGDVYWGHLRLRSSLDDASRWRLDLHVDSMRLYVVGHDGVEDVHRTGRAVSVAERTVAQVFPPAVEIAIPGHATRDLYFQMWSDARSYAGNGGIPSPELQPVEHAVMADRDHRLAQGLFAGFLLAIIGYNLFLLASVRDPSYLYYVLFLVAFAAFWVLHYGYVQEQAWPTGWSTLPDAFFYLVPLGFMAYVRFTQHFLQTRRTAPRFNVLLGIMLAAALVPIALAAVGQWSFATLAAAILALLVTATTTSAGIRVLLTGYRPARFYVTACVFFIAGTIVYTLTWLGMLPVNAFTYHSMQAGSALEALVLSLGLADHINVLRAEARAVRRRVDRIETARAELLAANVQQAELMGHAAHDLRSPLTGIREFAVLVKEEVAHLDHVQEPLQLIEAAADRTLSLVNRLLGMATLEHAGDAPSFEEVDMTELATEIVDVYQPRAIAKDQSLRLTMESDADLTVSADRARLLDAMDNLVGNAIKYAPYDTTIDVWLGYGHGTAQFTVRDEGPGLSKADHERLFQPFQRLSAQPTGGEPSTGLGLAITKKVIERHGGRIWVDSKPGAGCTFGFELPCTVSADVAYSLTTVL